MSATDDSEGEEPNEETESESEGSGSEKEDTKENGGPGRLFVVGLNICTML